MKVSLEFKIGLAFLAAIVLLIIGFNFLKGVNVFKPSCQYYAYYPDAEGLVVSNSVMIKGYKVGQVKKINYDFAQQNAFKVTIAINTDVKIPQGTQMVLCDEGLMGGKMIELVLPEPYNTNYMDEGSELIAVTNPSLLEMVSGVIPKLDATITHLDSTVEAVNNIVRSDEITNMLASLDTTTTNLKQSSKKLNTLMNNDVPTLLSRVDGITADLQYVSGNLKQTDFAATMAKVDATIADIDQFIEALNSPQGTIGALVNDRGLYNHIDTTVNSANALILDLKANPKRYVHFSLFGGRDKKEKAKK